MRISAGFPYFFPPLSLRDAKTAKQGVLVDGGIASALKSLMVLVFGGIFARGLPDAAAVLLGSCLSGSLRRDLCARLNPLPPNTWV